MTTDITLSPKGSFRDPGGRLYRDGDHILREIYPQQTKAVSDWLASDLACRWMAQRRMVPTSILQMGSGGPVVLEHERIFFPSYPWEWSPSQWMDAASLTLDLCEEAVDHGYILKDATPLNVLFSGSNAIFVDVLSFEKRDPNSPLWIAFAQFARTFLLPLAAFKYFGWPLSSSQQRRDGYEPADFASILPPVRRWFRPLLSLVTLPLLLEKASEAKINTPSVSEDLSIFAVRRLLGSTRALLQSLEPSRRTSRWGSYIAKALHYNPVDHVSKQTFVRESLAAISPKRVLDVGANTGVYSRIAAESGAEVVAWDSDVQAADQNWQLAHKEGMSIVPVVADFARPTPAIGWQNEENASLLDRARGQFDCVLMLGILHHILVADQIPLAAILDQLGELTTRWALIEWIPQEDGQFEGLCRGRQQLYAHLTEEHFVQVLSMKFAIRDRIELRNGRSLWLVERIR